MLEVDGVIVAAAGTHFAYEALAQVGNVLTVPLWRGRGYGAACTAGVVELLVRSGYPVISLFVGTLNEPALRIYERLGFRRHRELACFGWSRLAAKEAL